MKHALTAPLSAVSICALACLVPGVAGANGSDANALINQATPPVGSEPDGLDPIRCPCGRGLSGCARRLYWAERLSSVWL
jgi:hypothetical protein